MVRINGRKLRVVVKREPGPYHDPIHVTAYAGTRKAGFMTGMVGEPIERVPERHFVILDLEVFPEIVERLKIGGI